jgi:acetyl-CoA carboxylase biotin carboxyl carrier protein
MRLTNAEIKEILAILEASGWDEAQVTVGEVIISVSRGGSVSAAWKLDSEASPAVGPAGNPTPTTGIGAAPAPTAFAEAPDSTPPEEVASAAFVVTAMSVGIFWRSPSPGAPPFVEVGSSVQAGETLCIVEIMKLMNTVTADLAGTVTAIHCANGDYVELGTPMFSITPAVN